MQLFGAIELFSFLPVLFGIAFLTMSILYYAKFVKLLKMNKQDVSKWNFYFYFISIFIFLFVLQALQSVGILSLAVNPNLLSALNYFFGSVFVYLAIRSTYTLVKNILGKTISDKEAIQVFLDRTGKQEKDFECLYETFEIECESCKQNISYSIADVVKQNFRLTDKGVSIQTTFGVQTFTLRPSHQCKEERREIDVIHDQTLAFRSMNKSRIKTVISI